jgi:hypothetical protein
MATPIVPLVPLAISALAEASVDRPQPDMVSAKAPVATMARILRIFVSYSL